MDNSGVLESGAEGPGFQSQPPRCRVTVLGKLFTPIVPLFTKSRYRPMTLCCPRLFQLSAIETIAMVLVARGRISAAARCEVATNVDYRTIAADKPWHHRIAELKFVCPRDAPFRG